MGQDGGRAVFPVPGYQDRRRKERQRMASLVSTRVGKEEEREMVILAQQGDAKALEDLVRSSQPWVFNLVLRMVPDYHEAEDLSQDILLKTVLKLPSFKGESRFSTWLYRIAVNHVLNMKETRAEKGFATGGEWAEDEVLRRMMEEEIPDPKTIPGDLLLLAKEVRIKCMMGMLLCLNRKQRIVYILGAILGVGSKAGSEILSISEANFRQVLSRSRRRLRNYLYDRCSLLDPANPCTCERSVAASIHIGYIDPLQILFDSPDAPKVRQIITVARERLDNIEFKLCQDLYRDQPFQESVDFSQRILEILRSGDFQGLLDTPPRN
jgi:RNA polymerase sigma factor (sigma-70 family)